MGLCDKKKLAPFPGGLLRAIFFLWQDLILQKDKSEEHSEISTERQGNLKPLSLLDQWDRDTRRK